jgi:hypothetical protein
VAIEKRVGAPSGAETGMGRSRGQGRADRRLGYAFVAPVVVLLLLITAYPLVYNLWNSFHTSI